MSESKNLQAIKTESINVRELSSPLLRSKFENLVAYERRITARVIEYIIEVERRKLYVEAGFTSMFDYLVTGLKYSASSAYRRLDTARASIVMPGLAEKIESGALNLSQVTILQSASRQEKKMGHSVSAERKNEVMLKLENKSQSETEKIIDQDFNLPLQACSERHRRDETVEMTLRIPKDLFDNLERIKELYSHINPTADWVEVLALMAKDVLTKRDPLLNKAVLNKIKQEGSVHSSEKVEPNCTFAAEVIFGVEKHTLISETENKIELTPAASRQIPIRIRRMIYQRDRGQCQHRDAFGRPCGSRFQIEVDHITPRFAGGENDPGNLRLLCRTHNQFRYRVGAGFGPRHGDRIWELAQGSAQTRSKSADKILKTGAGLSLNPANRDLKSTLIFRE